MVVGILGGGQLARMMALAGYPLGLRFVVLEPSPHACAAPLAETIAAPYDDPEALAELARRADIITYEFENVPAASVDFLRDHAGETAVYPPPLALATAQDRLNEKRLFRELGIETPAFAAVDSLAELEAAMEQIGYPAVVKTRTQGYDGKGQAVLRSPADLAPAWREKIGGAAAIVEGFVPFEREVSIVAVRDRSGAIACYPLTENTHSEGILRLSVARPDDPLQPLAEGYVTRLMERLDYVGTIALELFQVGERLLANEFAPRVHNSGHWTQNGAPCCQFENHLRAITGLPLGQTSALRHAAMVNLIGHIPESAEVLRHPGAHLHLYDKAPRPGRKVGHINLACDDAAATFEATLQKLQALARP